MNGIWFDEKHSFSDLNLVLSKVTIPPASPKTTFVDIPGGDGTVDLTEALGEVRYKDREATMTFTAFPCDDFEAKKQQVAGLLNGRRCKIRLDKDPGYYWQGRCAVKEYASNKSIRQIIVGVTVAPYKLKSTMTAVTVPAGDGVEATLQNGRKTVVPSIICTAQAAIVFGGGTYTLNAGTHKVLDIALVAGGNPVTVTSAQPVEFRYQEGEL